MDIRKAKSHVVLADHTMQERDIFQCKSEKKVNKASIKIRAGATRRHSRRHRLRKYVDLRKVRQYVAKK